MKADKSDDTQAHRILLPLKQKQVQGQNPRVARKLKGRRRSLKRRQRGINSDYSTVPVSCLMTADVSTLQEPCC